MRAFVTSCFSFALLTACTQRGTVVLPDEDTAAETDTATSDDTADTAEPDTDDTAGPGDRVACPSYAPLDRDGAWWTYQVDINRMTFSATGPTVWNDLPVYGQVLDMPDYGVKITAWYTCEADGLHQAGTDVVMMGDTTTYFYDPQPLLMPAEPEVGDTWTEAFTTYEATGGASHMAASAGEGVSSTFRGTITGVETLELPSGLFEAWVLETEQDGTPDRMWWSDGVGTVKQGIEPQVMHLVEYGPM